MSDESERTLFVRNLHDDVTEGILYELFLQAGPLDKVSRPKDRESGKLKNFAFITYAHAASVAYAIHLVDGIKLLDRAIRCQHRNTAEVANYTTVGIHSIDCEKTLQHCLDGSIDETPNEEDHRVHKRSQSGGYQGKEKRFTPKPLDANQTWRNNINYHEQRQPSHVSNVMMGPGSYAAMSPSNNYSNSRSSYNNRSSSSNNSNYSNAKPANHYHNMNRQLLAGGSGGSGSGGGGVYDLRSQLSGGGVQQLHQHQHQLPIGVGNNYRSTKDDRYSTPNKYGSDYNNQHRHNYQPYSRSGGNSYDSNAHSTDSYNSYGNSYNSYNNSNQRNDYNSYSSNSSGYGSSSNQRNEDSYKDNRYSNDKRQHNNRDRTGSYNNDGYNRN